MTQMSEIIMTQSQIRNALTSYLTEHVLKNAAVVKDVTYNGNGSANHFRITLETVQPPESQP